MSSRIGVSEDVVGVWVPSGNVEGKAIDVGGFGKVNVRDPV